MQMMFRKTLLAAVFWLLGSFMLVTDARGDEVWASYYGYELAGSPTATGEPFEPEGLTVAHPYLPMNTLLLVCHDSCVVARVNDVGPAAWTGRGIDLSLGTARATGLLESGLGWVSVEVLF